MDTRAHWQAVYETRQPTEVSWYQPTAALSRALIRHVAPDLRGPIIDVGGGASTLVDGLLAEGYRRLTVLDVSGIALAKAAARLGALGSHVSWLEADVLSAPLPRAAYAVWHDRAVFHFLTGAAERRRYVEQVHASVQVGGHVLVATFAPDGPARCSGLEVVRYSPQELHGEFGADFQLVESLREEHRTPAGSVQPFIYCLCRVGGEPAGEDRRP